MALIKKVYSLFVSIRIAQIVSVVMIFVLTSSELTRYACDEWTYAISLEYEAEESSDAEPKTEVADQSDEVIFTNSMKEHYKYTLYRTHTRCYPPQKPAFGVCKVELEPPERRIS
jgi:hypothetical protein